jgi:hypothetical protein
VRLEVLERTRRPEAGGAAFCISGEAV